MKTTAATTPRPTVAITPSATPISIQSPAGTTVQPMPVQLVDANGKPADLSTSLVGPILAALVGALIAQGIAAGVAHRLRRGQERLDAFNEVIRTGFAARRSITRYRASITQPGNQTELHDATADAITFFRAAEFAYQQRFAGDASGPALAKARTAVERWARPEISDAEAEELGDQIMQHPEEWKNSFLAHDLNMREWLREDGQALHTHLDEAVTAFGRKSKKPATDHEGPPIANR